MSGIMETQNRVPPRAAKLRGRGNRNGVRMQQKRTTIRVNLLSAHGSPTRSMYTNGKCRCVACRGANRAYYRTRPEQESAAQRRYYETHREEKRERGRKWREANREKDAADARRRYEANPERYAEQGRKWRAVPGNAAAKRSRQRAACAAAPGTHTAADVAAQYLRQHGRCYWCAVKVGKTYHVDHVTPLVKKGSNGPDNLVISCPACNLSKGAKLPHEFSERLC